MVLHDPIWNFAQVRHFLAPMPCFGRVHTVDCFVISTAMKCWWKNLETQPCVNNMLWLSLISLASSGVTQSPALWWCSTVGTLRLTWPPSSSMTVLMWGRSISSTSSAHPKRCMTELAAPCSSPPLCLHWGGCPQRKRTRSRVRAAGTLVRYGTNSGDYRRLWLVLCAVTERSIPPSALVVTWSAVNSALLSFRWTKNINAYAHSTKHAVHIHSTITS